MYLDHGLVNVPLTDQTHFKIKEINSSSIQIVTVFEMSLDRNVKLVREHSQIKSRS